MSSKFCPTCVSSRKKKRSRSQESVDDGGFYEPAPRRKTSVSDNDDDSNDDSQQPFEVPQIFRPIRVDSPALDSVRPRPKPNIKTRFDNDGKAKPSSSSGVSFHQPDIILSPLASHRGGGGGDDSQYEEVGGGQGQSSSPKAPTDSEEKPSSLASDFPTGGDKEECGSSISSRSLSSLLNQLPGDESSRPLLSSNSQLDLEEDEEEEEEDEETTVVTQIERKSCGVTQESREDEIESDLTPRASPVPPEITLRRSSSPPPPVPSCPPPASSDSEYASSCSRSTSRSVSRTREPVLRRSFQSQMNADGPGFSLSLVDMSAIRYADSASSYCSESNSREASRSRSCSLGPESRPRPSHFLPVSSANPLYLRNAPNNSSSGINIRSPCGVDVATSTGTSFDGDNYIDNDDYAATGMMMVSIGIGTDGLYDEELGSRSATPTQEHPSFSGEEGGRSFFLNEDDGSFSPKSTSVRITLKNPVGGSGGGSSSADAISSSTHHRSNLPLDDDIIPVYSQSYPSLSRKSTSNRNANTYGNDGGDDDGEEAFGKYDLHGSGSSSGIITGTTTEATPTTSGQELEDVSSSKPNYSLGSDEGTRDDDLDSLELAQSTNKHRQNSNKWLYQLRNGSFKCNSNLLSSFTEDEGILGEDADEAMKPLLLKKTSHPGAKDSWLSLSLNSSIDEEDDQEDSGTRDGGIDREKYSPESSPSPNLSQISYESLPAAPKVGLGGLEELKIPKKLPDNQALDLASQSNVQDAFVIAVEQQARERLEKLSALKRIKPVDMTKLSHQLSEVPSGSGGETSELNGLIEAATGSPIYVTSASELSSSQSALHRTPGTLGGGGGGGGELQDSDSAKLHTQVTTPTSERRLSAASLRGNNVTVVGINTTSNKGDEDDSLSSSGHPVKRVSNGQYPDTAKKSTSKESVDSPKKTISRDTLGDSRESLEVEGARSSATSSRGRGGGGSSKGGRSVDSSRESIVETAQYANMINMVEWDNGPHREMAVDVPESFVPRNKTPPRYPPNKSSTLNSNNNNKTVVGKTPSVGLAGSVGVGGGVVSDGVGVRGNGTLPGQNGAAGKPVPPPRIGDSKEPGWSSSVNNNNAPVPHVPPRTVVSPSKTPSSSTPSRDEAERIRKYQEELKKRREQEEKHAKEQEFLRTSLRGSKKLQALENQSEEESPTLVTGFVNDAYDVDEIPYIPPKYDATIQTPVGLADLVTSLQRVQQTLKKNGLHLDETVAVVGSLMQTPEFQQILAVHNKVQDVWCFNAPPTPASAHGHQLVQECLGSLYNCSVPESAELVEILSRVDVEGVLYAHDKIAERERLLMTNDSPLNAGESVDSEPLGVVAVPVVVPQVPPPSAVVSQPKPSVRPAFVPEPTPDDRIKVVRIEKTQDPLGATVRNEADAVVIGRIVKGGAAERSGLLHENDEILEVNGIEMRGKSVNEVCDILSRLTGTLTFLIVPTQSPPTIQQRRDVLIHVRAHFDYDPEDDIYLPCRELGIAFSKGDVLHVINQDDPNWWQAHREGEEDQALAGLIPSKSFQEQREAVKQQLLGETETREKSKKGTLLCAKSHKKKKKKIPYSSAFNDDFDAEEIPTYEEVSLYYPRTSFKRPVVLIGPPNIGRHELRQRLMQESERFAAAVPHTSRTKKDGEIDGQDYHFISRAQFESDILARKFVEHGEFEKAYYGTSLDAIRSVVNLGRICVLNLHPQSLKMLRNSDLKPYIVFVAPPPLERLKQMRISRGEAYKEEELIDIIEKAREMEEKYGHYFDLVIINNDIERTYHELLQRINYTEREPQWVPAFWLKQ